MMKKLLCSLLALTLLLSMCIIFPNAAEVDDADVSATFSEAEAGTDIDLVTTSASCVKTQAEAVSWLKSQEGAKYNLDGAYGSQCSDFSSAYVNYVLTGNPYGGKIGVYNAYQYSNANLYPSDWQVFQNTASFIPQPGDIFVVTGADSRYGHTGVVVSSTVNNATVADQNGMSDWSLDYGSPAHIHNITWSGSYTPKYFIRPKFKNNVKYNIAYNANGGSGSMTGQTVSANEWFTIKPNTFSRSGYTFNGYYVNRKSDNTWYTTDGAKWQQWYNINDKGYSYKRYVNNASFKLDSEWTNGASDGDTFTFYAQWLSNTPSLEFHDNYSGFNYLMGSDLGTGYNNYTFSRNTNNYSIDVDSSQRLNGQNSLKITGAQAGSSGNDLEFRTSTNMGYAEGTAADNKNMVFSFWGKSSVNGAKMYARWGYSSSYKSVSLTTEWQLYNISLPKGKYYSISIHPYFDKSGVFYINSPVVTDGTWTSRFEPETEAGIEIRYYTLNGQYTNLPTRDREGYYFDGWYTDAVGGTKITEGSSVFSGDKCVYAHWTKAVSDTPAKTVVSDSRNKYELYNNAMSWEDAKVFCERKGGHLVTIDSAKENDIVLSLIDNNSRYSWIGAKYDETARAWSWITGEDFKYDNWATGEPSNKNGTSSASEPYAMMYPLNYSYNISKGSWNDCAGINDIVSYYCWQNSSFICEYEPITVILGDADGDGEITSIDVTMVMRANVELDTGIDEDVLMNGDVDGNGALEIIDATFIQRYLALMDTPYPIGNAKI